MTNLCLTTLGTMKELYEQEKAYPSSDVGNELLIRSHIHYHAGQKFAERAVIKPSRGHSYKVGLYGENRSKDMKTLKITDYYDHRNGVTGLFSCQI